MKHRRRIPLSFSGTTQLPPAKRSTWAGNFIFGTTRNLAWNSFNKNSTSFRPPHQAPAPLQGINRRQKNFPGPASKLPPCHLSGTGGAGSSPAGLLRGRTIFLFPASRPSPPAPCQIKRGSPSIEQSCHKQDRSSSVPSPCGAYIPAGHFRIPSRHAAQRAFTMRHGNRSRQRIHPVRANCQSHEGGRQQQAGQNSPYRQPYFPDHPAITA